MSKWLRTLAPLLVMAMLVLAGCGAKEAAKPAPAPEAPKAAAPAAPAEPKPAPAKAPDPVSLSIWIMPNSPNPEPELRETLQPFLDKNKHISLNITVLDWGSAWSRVTTAATSGDGPDVMQLGTTWVPAVAAMNAIEDVSGKVAELGGKDAFYPAAWATSGIAGKPQVYAVPWFVDARAVYYRTDVFQAAGVDPKQAFQNWDTLKAALKKINGTQVNGQKTYALGYPGKNDWNVAHNVIPWIWGAGGSELSSDLKQATINSDAAVDALVYYTGLYRDGLVDPGTIELNTAEVENRWYTGQYAVYIGGSYVVRDTMVPNAKNGHADDPAAKNYAVSPIPEGPKGRYTFFGGSNLAVFKSSKHKQEAWELVKFLTGREGAARYVPFSGFIPAIKGVEDKVLALNPKYGAFLEAAKYGRSYPAIPAWGQLETALVKHVANIWDVTTGAKGTYSRNAIKQELDQAAKEWNDILKQAQ